MFLILTKNTKAIEGNRKAYVNNTIIPNSWHNPTVQAEKSERCEQREVDCSLPYGAASNM